MPTIFIVEDREPLRRMLERALEREGYQVLSAARGDEAAARAKELSYDLVLTDLKLPGASGLEVLAASRQHHPRAPVVVLTAYGSVKTAVEAMKLGAADFLEKPVEIDELYQLTRDLLREDDPDSESYEASAPFQAPGGPMVVGQHPQLNAALRLLKRVAPTDSTVLITGESGTGKELFARSLHALSPRASGPFVAINCAALPEPLLENELFGHERGAYTGANSRQRGRFELAAGGTLFLDEIGDLGLGVQAKVLRVLEERTFERVGGSKPVRADVRLAAATNRDLEELVAQGSFRQDLYFRLEVFPIQLPPLRHRASDIPALTEHLLDSIGQRLGQPKPSLTPAAMDLLIGQPWPGNVRQLANVLERAVILADGGTLDAPELQALVNPAGSTPGPPATGQGSTSDSTEDHNAQRIRQALLATEGDKKQAAQRLGWSYRHLQRKIRELDLDGFPKYRS